MLGVHEARLKIKAGMRIHVGLGTDWFILVSSSRHVRSKISSNGLRL